LTKPAEWQSVDELFERRLLKTSNSAVDFEWITRANAEAGLPAIDVSPLQGKFLHLLVQISGAKRVLEIGTLGGYSTAWMASALPEDGELTTIEINAAHAGVAAANLAQAGLTDRVHLRLGDANAILAEMIRLETSAFDFVFIDADKVSGEAYFKSALELTRPGSTIVCDNMVRGGNIIDEDTDDPDVAGTQRLLGAVAAEPSVSATAIQTVGQKGHDGFAIMTVEASSRES
tara:strand:+ start:198539 stop:199234 length:696 start_codon:yes stop_codon:yes gene_type:complete